MSVFFRDIFTQNVEMAVLVKEELKERLNAIIEGCEETEKHKKIKKKIAEAEKVTDYEEWEIDYERQFEKNCAVITEQLHKDAKTMSVMEYFTSISILSDRVKEQEKNSRKLKSR